MRTEVGTTSPLARKCKDQFPDLFIYIPLADSFTDKTAPLLEDRDNVIIKQVSSIVNDLMFLFRCEKCYREIVALY